MENKTTLVKITDKEYEKAIVITKNVYPEYDEDFKSAVDLYREDIIKGDDSEFIKAVSNIPNPKINDILLNIAVDSSLHGSYNSLAIDLKYNLEQIRKTALGPIISDTKIKLISIDPVIELTLEEFEEKRFDLLLKHGKIDFLSNVKMFGNGNAQTGIRKLINYVYSDLEGGFYV